MSYRDESALLARELAHLAATGSSRTLNPNGLDVALAGRSETLRLLRHVLADTTGINRNNTFANSRPGLGGVRRSVEELEAHPVGMLSRTLATHPAPRPQAALSDLLAAHAAHAAQGTVGAAESWGKAARHALLASHEWSTHQPRPDPHQQWSAVADVAALAQVVTVLDRHLHTAARARPDTDPALVEALQAASTSGLRSAATQAATLAGAGPLPEWGEPGSQPSSTRLLLVHSPADVTTVQGRIAAQITAATDLGPQAVTLLATGQARILTAAAAALASSDPQRAARATELAGHLTGRRRQRTPARLPGTRRPAASGTDPRTPTAPVRRRCPRLDHAGGRGVPSRAGRRSRPLPRRRAGPVPTRRPIRALRALADRRHPGTQARGPAMAASHPRRPRATPVRLAIRRRRQSDRDPHSPPATLSTPAAAPAPRHTLAGVLNLDRPTRPHRPGRRPQPDTGRD